MAMSRSFGAMLFTTVPPIRSSPELMSSSPAIMFSVVDLPQPEGPTRIMNSPSAISMLTRSTARAPSGNRLVTSLRTISAISLSLHGTRRQPRHDAALEEQHEHNDRNCDDHGRGADRSGGLLELGASGEETDRGRHGTSPGRRGQRDREQEVVPAEDENQNRRGEHAGRGERGDDLGERLERGGPV